jgi:hypothetical protein
MERTGGNVKVPEAKPLEDRKIEEVVDRQGQRERAKREVTTGKLPEKRPSQRAQGKRERD